MDILLFAPKMEIFYDVSIFLLRFKQFLLKLLNFRLKQLTKAVILSMWFLKYNDNSFSVKS